MRLQRRQMFLNDLMHVDVPVIYVAEVDAFIFLKIGSTILFVFIFCHPVFTLRVLDAQIEAT